MTRRVRGAPRGFGGAALVYMASTALERGLPFLLLPVLTRMIGAEQFGIVALALAVANVLALLFSAGLNFAIVRLYFDDDESTDATHWAMLIRVQVLLAVVLGAVAWLTGPAWGDLFGGIDWGPELQVAVGYGVALAIQRTTQGVLRASQRPTAFASVVVLQVGLGVGLGLALAVSHEAVGYLAGLAIGASVAAVVGLVLTYRRPAWRLPVLIGALTLSAPFLVHALATWVLGLSDRILVDRYEGLAGVGEYQVAAAVGGIGILVFEGVFQAWAPLYYRREEASKAGVPRALARPLAAAAGGALFLLVLSSPLVLAVVAPASFGRPLMVVALIAATGVVRTSYFLASAVAADVKNSGVLAVASLGGAVLNVALNVVLIPPYGLPAAAATTLVSFALQAVLVLWWTSRSLALPVDLASLVRVWVVVTVAIVAAGAIPASPPGWVVRIALAVVATPVVLRLLGRLRNAHRTTTEVAHES